MELRDYQRACHDAVLNAWGVKGYWDGEREMVRSTLANIPTAAGKTIIASKLIETLTVNHEARCLFLADTDELCQQPLDKFRRACNIFAAVEKASDRASLNARVVVGSAQTLVRANRRERFPVDHFTHIFVDEAHRGSERNKQITDYFAPSKVLGLTATAFRKNLATLSDFYEDVCFELGLFDLIGEGYIVPIKVQTLPITVDLSEVRESKFMGEKDLNTEDLDTTIAPWFEKIADAIIEHAPKRQIIAYLPLIKSSQAFVEICVRKGLHAIHVDGQDPDRSRKIESFARKEFQLLSNSSLLTTGWDCTTVDCLLNLRPTKSDGLFRQMTGRVIRTLDGTVDGLLTKEERKAAIASSAKPDALILDLLWQTEDFGLVGPANLIASNEADAREIQKRLNFGSAERNLEEVSAEVQADREAELRKILEERAARAAGMMDAMQIGLMLGDHKLVNFEAVVKWEKQAVSKKQGALIAQMGINPESVTNRGHAAKLLTAVFSRQKNGLAPIEAFKLLQEAGVEHPEKCSLDDSIRALGENFPMTFGRKYRGFPMGAVPIGFWWWVREQYEAGQMDKMEGQHPAAFRYMRKKLGLQSEARQIESPVTR